MHSVCFDEGEPVANRNLPIASRSAVLGDLDLGSGPWFGVLLSVLAVQYFLDSIIVSALLSSVYLPFFTAVCETEMVEKILEFSSYEIRAQKPLKH